MGKRLKEPAFLVISIIFVAFCLFSSVWWIVNFRASYLAMSALFILFIPAICIAEYLIGMRMGVGLILLVLSVAAGGILGSPFNFYTLFPHFDTLLHGISGVIFAALGYMLAERLFGRINTRTRFVGAIVMALSFSLAIAVVWEIHEYNCTLLLGMETMDDTLVDYIKSFVLSGTRSEPTILEGITHTVIYYGEGKSFVIEGGYLDIGIIDTVSDMIICTVGAVVFSILAIIARRLPVLNKLLIPSVTRYESDEESVLADEAAVSMQTAE